MVYNKLYIYLYRRLSSVSVMTNGVLDGSDISVDIFMAGLTMHTSTVL